MQTRNRNKKDERDKIIIEYINGLKPQEIADKMGIDIKEIRLKILTIPLNIRMGNIKFYREKLKEGYDEWDKYILSKDRKLFYKLSPNGLWVRAFVVYGDAKNKKYPRLGQIYLGTIEKEIKDGLRMNK